MHLAITNRHHATLVELLKAGADVSVCNDETYPPLHLAALVGDVQVGAKCSFPLSERERRVLGGPKCRNVCVPLSGGRRSGQPARVRHCSVSGHVDVDAPQPTCT